MTRALRLQYPGSIPTQLDVDDHVAACSLAEVISTRLMTPEQKTLPATRATLRLSGGGVARVFDPSTPVSTAIEAFDSMTITIEICVRAVGGAD
jgi:hypothetical protein